MVHRLVAVPHASRQERVAFVTVTQGTALPKVATEEYTRSPG
jgi:hypothetical protein